MEEGEVAVADTYCDSCKMAPHDGPCKTDNRPTWQEMHAEDRRFWRGLRVSGGQPMGPIDPGDMSDLWRDGE